jgi:hypothetical protein
MSLTPNHHINAYTEGVEAKSRLFDTWPYTKASGHRHVSADVMAGPNLEAFY